MHISQEVRKARDRCATIVVGMSAVFCNLPAYGVREGNQGTWTPARSTAGSRLHSACQQQQQQLHTHACTLGLSKLMQLLKLACMEAHMSDAAHRLSTCWCSCVVWVILIYAAKILHLCPSRVVSLLCATQMRHLATTPAASAASTGPDATQDTPLLGPTSPPGSPGFGSPLDSSRPEPQPGETTESTHKQQQQET